MKVDIVTPAGEQFAGDADEIVAPGTLGEVGLLPGHRDMCMALSTGVCRIRRPGVPEPEFMLVDEGYLQVSRGGRIIIVTEHAERAEDVDLEKAERDLGEARATLESARESVGKSSWQVKKHHLDIVEARLKLVELARR